MKFITRLGLDTSIFQPPDDIHQRRLYSAFWRGYYEFTRGNGLRNPYRRADYVETFNHGVQTAFEAIKQTELPIGRFA
jgi:hypothetical protein